jgi:hypothetical protein
MAEMHASVITTATIRVAGQVPTEIALRHLSTPEQEASLRIGELLAPGPTSPTLPNVIGRARVRLVLWAGLVGGRRAPGWRPAPR